METPSLLLSERQSDLVIWDLNFRIHKTKWEREYIVYVHNLAWWDRVGYLYFQLTHEVAAFKWMLIHDQYKNFGYSKIFLQAFENYARLYGVSTETIHQYKPLTCAILVKNWFSPVHWLIEWKRVYVGKTLDNPSNCGIFCENPGLQYKISQSRKVTKQWVIVVNSVKDLVNPVPVRLAQRYIKQNHRNDTSMELQT